MNTPLSHPDHRAVETIASEAGWPGAATAVDQTTSSGARTCGHCQYDGPLQIRYTYPLLLRWYAIAIGFVLGILPGMFLLSWRQSTPPTIAMTCPLCLFLRLEPDTVPRS